ncbi:MAG: peptidase S41, partial [Marinirhabdus sp.]|nr:peptidase S41 [Marinirhabdus sp.]
MFLKLLKCISKKQQQILYVFCILISGTIDAQKISKSDVLYDLEYLVFSLEQTHINPFAYTSKKDFIENYEQVKQEVKKDSFTLQEATTLFQKVISNINNAHTTIDFPAQSYIAYAKSGGTIFPLELSFENDTVYVRKNWSSEGKIEAGMELSHINGRTIQQVLARLYPQVSAERIYFENAQIESLSFPRLYWQVFGEVDEFEIKIHTQNTVKTYTLNAIKAMDEYEMKRNNLLNYERRL